MDRELIVIAERARAMSGGLPGGPLWSSAEIIPLERGGSGRRFLRLRQGERSAVVLVQPGGGAEFGSYVANGYFLRSLGIGVPEFYGVDEEKSLVLMEDLGSVHLEDALKEADRTAELSLYRGCVDILVKLETEVTEAMLNEGVLEDRLFDEDKLLGETEYFQREFLGSFCRMEAPTGWDQERLRLARTLAGLPRVFMHRDFQSRNILLKDGELRIVDFQTAQRGPGLYDAASLLKDAYHPLPRPPRESLLEMLYSGLSEGGPPPAESFEGFCEIFTLAGIQRNLQALAAFAYLGSRKGRKEFLESIPAGLRLLDEGVGESGGFPVLKGMLERIRENMEKGK